jgi:hypothetical protein
MTMTAKLWSINALATEFDLDRRTVARRIKGIAPAGDMAGKPAWRLADVAGALTGTGTQAKAGGPVPPVPPGFEALAGLPALDQIATFAMLQMCYRTPARVAALAVASGADCATAFALYRAASLALVRLVVDVSRECGLAPLAQDPGASLFDLQAFDECDWHALTQSTGEAVDLAAWTERATARFADAA